RRADETAGAPVPQAGHAVAAGGQQMLAVGTEASGIGPARMAETGEFLARRQLPDAHPVVPRGGGNQPAVGRELHVVAQPLVLELVPEPAGQRVPDARRVGVRPEGQETAAVRAEADGAVVDVSAVVRK